MRRTREERQAAVVGLRCQKKQRGKTQQYEHSGAEIQRT